MITRLEATRLIPREPARVEMRNKRPLGKCKMADRSDGIHTMEALALNGPLPDVAGVIEFFCPLLPCGSAGGTIQAIVVDVPEPLAITFTSTSQLESPFRLFNTPI